MRFRRPSNCPWWKNRRPGREERDDRRGLVHVRRERGRRARLVVVLQEARELVLVVEPGVEVLAHRPRVAFAQAVVEPLVVGVVEALLLQRPFQVPVDLGHEAEARDSLAHALRSPSARTAAAAMPQVRSKTSGSTSIAMSQRTPSHWPAIFSSSPIIASCVAGLP